MSRRRTALVAAGLALPAVVALLASGFSFDGRRASHVHGVPTGFARVVRTDVVERQQAAGTLGFRGSYTIYNGARSGVVTWLPSPGRVVRRGQRLYELDRAPVPLLYGVRPAFRTFALGMSDGGDVRDLKQNLLALGFSNDGRIRADDHFDLATRGAIKQWQQARSVRPTGQIPLGGVVFLPHAIRVGSPTAGVSVGATVQPGSAIISATATERAVLVPLDPGAVARIKVGDRVIVTMPGGTQTAGRITTIGRVATSPGSGSQGGDQTAASPTVPLTVSLPNDFKSGLDQAPVQVSITSRAARNVLAVPITALLARASGGYAVQVGSGSTAQLVPVTTGLFDDVAGVVQVSSAGLRAGMRVVVPVG